MDEDISRVMNQVERDLLNMEQIVGGRITSDGAAGPGSPTGDGDTKV